MIYCSPRPVIVLTIIPLFQFISCSFSFGNRPHQTIIEPNLDEISFSSEWQVLGPFRSGTREATWGADPLEYQGGFGSLDYDETATFNSALGANGTVEWSTIQANVSIHSPGHAKATLKVDFPETGLSALQYIYGWPALQYQAWARGSLNVNKPSGQTVAIFLRGLLEFSVDGKRYFGGDYYNYRKAPVTLYLSQGSHVIDLRLNRDVRVLGAVGNPTIEVVIEAEIRHTALNVDTTSLLTSDLTQGKLGSHWASVHVQSNIADWIEILSVNSPDAHQHDIILEKPLTLSPYQGRPLVFRIILGAPSETEFLLEITYKTSQENRKILKTETFFVGLTERLLTDAHKVTFLHPARMVSYAVLRPPPLDPVCSTLNSSPVIIGLHGAGLEADSLQVREMLDGSYGICAWVLFPTGVTPWSADDWHNWGTADVKAAVTTIAHWIENVGWEGPKVSLDSWIVVGHSNGGQGAWYLSTHYPDSVIATAPVSGYTSIQNYVPYSMWQESEPLLSFVLEKSRSRFKHELLLDNLAGITVLQQHGSDDDNVPAYHSRLMHEILGHTEWPSEYDELPGKGHWFKGVLTTPALLRFYKANTQIQHPAEIPANFTMIIPSSGDMGSKNGIFVDQLQSPDINGQVKVTRDLEKGIWYMQTRNIHRFHLVISPRANLPIALVLNDAKSPFKVDPDRCESTWYVRDSLGRWTASNETKWKNVYQRYGRQLGTMDAILRSNGPFSLEMCSDDVEHVALQISHNFLQYFAADSQLIKKCQTDFESFSGDTRVDIGNVVTFAIGEDLPPSKHTKFPIRAEQGRLILSKGCPQKDADLDIKLGSDLTPRCSEYHYEYENGLGALFLRPLEGERLELVVWGADVAGLEQAARLVPALTGVGQPDFLILSDSCRWKGHAGLYGAGYFDKSWRISHGSYISRDPEVDTFGL